MNPKEYIVNWFQSNQKRLSLKNVQYAYHNYSDTHFVYCEPSVESLNFDSRMLLNDFIISFSILRSRPSKKHTYIYNSAIMTLYDFNRLSVAQVREELFKCCGCTSWVNKLMAYFPFSSLAELKTTSDEAWKNCSADDWLEAFSHHPKIGEKAGSDKKHTDTKEWAQQEQAGVKNAVEEVKAKLASANQLYENKFGYIFIVCATGKSADEMLAILNTRLNNDPAKEIQVAAGEQNKITHLRMDKLFS